MARQTKAEKIANIDPNTIAKLGSEPGMKTLRNYVSSLRSGFLRRSQAIKRSGLYSYSLDKVGNIMTAGQIKHAGYHQLISEYYKLSDFFNSQTSTVQGIKSVNREQDIRFFGATKSGRPKRTMTNEERQEFWSLYAEYLNMYRSDASTKYASTVVQQQLADALFVDKIPTDNLVDFLRQTREKVQEGILDSIPDSGGGTDVYHWRRDSGA